MSLFSALVDRISDSCYRFNKKANKYLNACSVKHKLTCSIVVLLFYQKLDLLTTAMWLGTNQHVADKRPAKLFVKAGEFLVGFSLFVLFFVLFCFNFATLKLRFNCVFQ